MLTSLAPSPIESVIFFNLLRISRTTYAFCFGVTRQQTTDSEFYERSNNVVINFSFFKMIASDSPSIKSPFFFLFC